jgi:hypothetical protein
MNSVFSQCSIREMRREREERRAVGVSGVASVVVYALSVSGR